MIDRSLTIAGLALSFFSLSVPKMFPDLPKRWAVAGFVSGLVLLGAAAGTFFINAGAQQSEPTISGDCNAVGNNDSNCSPYINQAPKPSLVVTGEEDWIKVENDRYRKSFQVKLVNSAAASIVKITAYGNDVLSVGFFGRSSIAAGDAGNGIGYAWGELLTPNLIQGFSVYAKKPTPVRIETSFD